MNIAILEKATFAAATAWRVRYKTPTSADDEGSPVTDAPRRVVAARSEIKVSDALSEADGDTDDLVIVWAPPGAREVEARAKNWIAAAPTLVRASISTISVLWAKNQAVLFCAPELAEAGYDAIVRFTVIAREADWLQNRMSDSWRFVDDNLDRLHAASPRVDRKSVDARSEEIARLNMRLLTTQTSLEQLDQRLDATSKRLCGELILAANLHDRLEMLEEPIEFIRNHYELVQGRLQDSKHAMRETWLELLIILLLTINTAAAFLPADETVYAKIKPVAGGPAMAVPTGQKRTAEVAGTAGTVAADAGAGATDANAAATAPSAPAATAPSAPALAAANTEGAAPARDEAVATCRAKLAAVAAGKSIPFAEGASTVGPLAKRTLSEVSGVLKQCAGVTLEIRVEDVAPQLAERRAHAVAAYLVGAGAPKEMASAAAAGAQSASEGVRFGTVVFLVKAEAPSR